MIKPVYRVVYKSRTNEETTHQDFENHSEAEAFRQRLIDEGAVTGKVESVTVITPD